jgi:hypothetical protein
MSMGSYMWGLEFYWRRARRFERKVLGELEAFVNEDGGFSRHDVGGVDVGGVDVGGVDVGGVSRQVVCLEHSSWVVCLERPSRVVWLDRPAAVGAGGVVVGVGSGSFGLGCSGDGGSMGKGV